MKAYWFDWAAQWSAYYRNLLAKNDSAYTVKTHALQRRLDAADELNLALQTRLKKWRAEHSA